MNQKTTLLAVSFLTLGTLSLFGQTPAPAAPAAPAPAAPSSSWTFTPAFASQYMFRGARLGGASFQPTLEYGAGSLVVGVWSNFPVRDKVVGQSDPEIDPYASYTIDVVKDTFSIQPGVTWYNYPNAKKADGFYKQTFEPSLAVNYTVEGIKLTPKLYYDVVLAQTTFEVSAAYSIPLKDLGTEIALLGQYGTFKATDAIENSTPATKNWGNYLLAGFTLPFQVGKDQKLSLGWAYTKGSDNFLKQGNRPQVVNTAALGRGVVTISYAFSF